MENMDYVKSIKIEVLGTPKTLTKENYKDIRLEIIYARNSAATDNKLLDFRMDKLVELWEYKKEKTGSAFSELSEIITKLGKYKAENDIIIEKCDNTLELIDLFANIRGWE